MKILEILFGIGAIILATFYEATGQTYLVFVAGILFFLGTSVYVIRRRYES